MPFQGGHLGIFPGKSGLLFTVALLKEIDQQCASAYPTVASFWKVRCSYVYHALRNEPGLELGQSAPGPLYNLRYWVNLTYLDFVQLQEAPYQEVFGCTCGHAGGIPRRVVFDGNSLSYRSASAQLEKPW